MLQLRNLDKWSRDVCLNNFRFEKDGLLQLVDDLDIPTTIRVEGCSITDTVENYKLCSHLNSKSKIIKLTESTAAVVQETRSFQYWSGYKRFKCKFEVKESQKHQIVAVIQQLSFRRDASGNCTDYVQFKSDSEESEKFCGQISALKPQYGHIKPDPPNVVAFVVPKEGKMDVEISVASIPLHHNEMLHLKIVFTSAKDCSLSHPYLSKCESGVCISRGFNLDGIVNCPDPYCSDEGDCFEKDGKRTGAGNRVTVGAITAFILSFLLFFGFIWFMRRYRKLCWSPEFNNPISNRGAEEPPVVHSPNSDDIDDPAPSAPPVSMSAVAIMPDKDLPPPYESLFPSR